MQIDTPPSCYRQKVISQIKNSIIICSIISKIALLHEAVEVNSVDIDIPTYNVYITMIETYFDHSQWTRFLNVLRNSQTQFVIFRG